MGPFQGVSAICSSRCDLLQVLAGLRIWQHKAIWKAIMNSHIPSSASVYSLLRTFFWDMAKAFFKSSISAWAGQAVSQVLQSLPDLYWFPLPLNAFSGFSASSSLHREGRAGWMLCSGRSEQEVCHLKFSYYWYLECSVVAASSFSYTSSMSWCCLTHCPSEGFTPRRGVELPFAPSLNPAGLLPK